MMRLSLPKKQWVSSRKWTRFLEKYSSGLSAPPTPNLPILPLSFSSPVVSALSPYLDVVRARLLTVCIPRSPTDFTLVDSICHTNLKVSISVVSFSLWSLAAPISPSVLGFLSVLWSFKFFPLVFNTSSCHPTFFPFLFFFSSGLFFLFIFSFYSSFFLFIFFLFLSFSFPFFSSFIFCFVFLLLFFFFSRNPSR